MSVRGPMPNQADWPRRIDYVPVQAKENFPPGSESASKATRPVSREACAAGRPEICPCASPKLDGAQPKRLACQKENWRLFWRPRTRFARCRRPTKDPRAVAQKCLEPGLRISYRPTKLFRCAAQP